MEYLPDSDRLEQMAEALREQYAQAEPYPHVVVDGLMPEGPLQRVAQAAGTIPAAAGWRRGDPVFQRHKQGTSDLAHMPAPVRDAIMQLNSPLMLQFLERLTGIPRLIADPWLVGGGVHQVGRGGFLKVHRDYLKHPRYHIDRRLNLLLYLNENWSEEWGGHLELWDRDMGRCVRRVAPVFNRCVIFTLSQTSFHGHPEPLACPEDRPRRSLALYYYSTAGPVNPDRDDYETPWKARPGEAFDFDAARRD